MDDYAGVLGVENKSLNFKLINLKRFKLSKHVRSKKNILVLLTGIKKCDIKLLKIAKELNKNLKSKIKILVKFHPILQSKYFEEAKNLNRTF